VMALSDHMTAEFSEKYAVLIKERRICRRAVFVIGRDDKIAYVAYMPALSEEPNYAEVIETAKKALG